MTRNLNVLFLTNELPYFTGGGAPIRDFNLLKNLSDHYQCTVMCFSGPDPKRSATRLSALSAHCERVILVDGDQPIMDGGHSRAQALRRLVDPMPRRVEALSTTTMRSRVRGVLRDRHYDLIHANHVEMGALLSEGDQARRVVGPEAVSPKLKRLLRIESDSLRRILDYIEWRKLVRYERALYRAVDLCILVSEQERRTVLGVAPDARVVIVPNGVDTSFFRFDPERDSRTRKRSVLFVGSMSYVPNEDAVLFFYREMWPLLKARFPDLTWQIVGRAPSPEVKRLACADISVTGWVEDVRPYMEQSLAMIVPLRSGGGTRLKILEAMAAGLPVVSTTIGAEGLAVSDGETILLADEPNDFREAIETLVSQPDVVQTMRLAGRRLVESRYDWSTIADRLDDAYQSLFGGKA